MILACRKQLIHTLLVPADSIEAIQEAWTSLVRRGTLPALQERLNQEAGFEVRRGDYSILARLHAAGPTPISELAEALSLDISTVSRSIKELSEQGMVERQRGQDQRQVVAATTPAGVERMLALRAVRERVLRSILSEWSEEDRRALSALLGRLSEGFAEYLRDPNTAVLR